MCIAISLPNHTRSVSAEERMTCTHGTPKRMKVSAAFELKRQEATVVTTSQTTTYLYRMAMLGHICPFGLKSTHR